MYDSINLTHISDVGFTIFGFKNAKITFCKKFSVLSAVFIELKYMRSQTRLADLKNTKHLIFYL